MAAGNREKISFKAWIGVWGTMLCAFMAGDRWVFRPLPFKHRVIAWDISGNSLSGFPKSI
jgi:hypothetical protein